MLRAGVQRLQNNQKIKQEIHMSDIAALTARIDKLEHELGIEPDINQIRWVQYSYGYFLDKSQYNECVDLFSDEGDVWFLGGIYKGKAEIERLYKERFYNIFTAGHNGPKYGWQKMPIDFIPMATTCFPEDPLGPDELIDHVPRLWPATDIVDFHYPYPVAGGPIVADNSRAIKWFKD
jgi:hypothetical protein